MEREGVDARLRANVVARGRAAFGLALVAMPLCIGLARCPTFSMPEEDASVGPEEREQEGCEILWRIQLHRETHGAYPVGLVSAGVPVRYCLDGWEYEALDDGTFSLRYRDYYEGVLSWNGERWTWGSEP